MGWTSCTSWHKKSQVIDDEARQFMRSGYTILASASTRQGAYFAVKHQDGRQFIACSLIERRGGSWSIKTMTDAMGPAMDDCPPHVLAAVPLTPDTHHYAVEWREKCREAWERKQRNKGLDLTGKLIELYGNRYHVLAKSTERRGSYNVLLVKDIKEDGTYCYASSYAMRMKSTQVKDAKVLGEAKP